MIDGAADRKFAAEPFHEVTAQKKAKTTARLARGSNRGSALVQFANNHELLVVLDRPDIPLHTNGSERDIRCHMTKRKISGGTRSDPGRDCRDAFLGLAKTCTKLGITFWDYIGARLAVPHHATVAMLPDIIRSSAVPA